MANSFEHAEPNNASRCAHLRSARAARPAISPKSKQAKRLASPRTHSSRASSAHSLAPGTLVERAAVLQLPAAVRAELEQLRAERTHAVQLAILAAQAVGRAPGPDDALRKLTQTAAQHLARAGCATPIPILNTPDTTPLRTDLAAATHRITPPPGGWLAIEHASNAAFAVRVVTPSMEPLLHPGDIVALEGQFDPKPGAWALIELATSPNLHLAYLSPAKPAHRRLAPANPNYPSLEVPTTTILACHKPIALIRSLLRPTEPHAQGASAPPPPA